VQKLKSFSFSNTIRTKRYTVLVKEDILPGEQSVRHFVRATSNLNITNETIFTKFNK